MPPSEAQQEMLKEVRQAVRSVQQVAVEGEGGVGDCEEVERLVVALEGALLEGAHSGVEIWDVVGGPVGENEEFQWVQSNVAMLKSKGADRTVLGRRWLRDSLNTSTLSAFLALITELHPTVLSAYYQPTSILSTPTSSLLLNTIIPIGGADIDARRGVDGASLLNQAFITFDLQIAHEHDDDVERKRSESLLTQGIITQEKRKVKKVVKTRRKSPKPTRHRPPLEESPIGAVIEGEECETPVQLTPNEKFDRPRADSLESAGSEASRGSHSSADTVSITSADKDTVRRELEEWRKRRTHPASPVLSSCSSDTKEHCDLRGVPTPEPIPAVTTETDTAPQETQPPVEAAEGDEAETTEASNDDPKDAHDEKYSEIEEVLRNKDAIISRRVKGVAPKSAYERYLDSYHARLVQWEQQLLETEASLKSSSPRSTTPPPADNRFTLRHTQSAMMATIKSNTLILSSSRLPSVFRIDKGNLVHVGTGRVIVLGFFQGRDPCLQLKSKAIEPCDWVYDTETGELAERNHSTSACVRPYDDACPEGVQLVVSEPSDSARHLANFAIERAESDRRAQHNVVSTDEPLDARILLNTNKTVDTPPPTPNQSFAWAIPAEDAETYERHRMRLITDVKEKHADYAEKERRIDAQARRCKGCLSDLKKTYSPIYFSWRYDTVHFCWYLGAYYCPGCHDNTVFVPIPARLLHLWDSKPRPVCNDAYSYLTSIWRRPIICVSALRPLLFEKVTALKSLRTVRVQLNILYNIVQVCPFFAAFVSTHPSFITNDTLYYLEGSELYSPEDMLSINQTQPYLEYPTRISPEVLTNLEMLRNKMIEHVVSECPGKCSSAAAKTCEACAGSVEEMGPIYEFETGKVQTCPKCRRVYHKACYQMQPCKHCF